MAFSKAHERDTIGGALQFHLAPHAEAGVLLGRDRGDELRHALERALLTLSEDDPIAVDFRGVVAISVPFADGFLGPLLSGRLGGYHEDHPFLLLHASSDVEETIAAALKLRGLTVLSLGPQGPRLLGAEPALEETMRVASEIPEFSATDIANALGLTTQAANNRLKALLKTGALIRSRVTPERGGREFRYKVPEVPVNSG